MSSTEKLPSIAELHTLEKEIQSLLVSYKITHQEYLDIIVSKGTPYNAEKKLVDLDQMNQSILSLVDKAKSKITQLYPEGIKNQDNITLDNEKLNDIIQNMKEESDKLEELLGNLVSVEGENQSASTEKKSAYYQYVVFAILSMVVMALTIKTFTTSDSSSIETIILVIAGALILYHTGYLVF